MEEVKKPRHTGRKGGRYAGIPNRNRDKIMFELKKFARCQYGLENYDPLVEALKHALDADNDMDAKDRAKIHTEIAKYVHSQLKAIDMNMNASVRVSHEDALNELE